MPQLQQTQNYDQFIFLDYNRDVVPNHVEELIDEIKRHNKLSVYPITVTPQLEVVDGQHRLLAAKALNVPIYYVVDEDYISEDIIVVNNTKRGWTLENYIKYYAHHGNENYIKLEQFLDKNHFTVQTGLCWLGVSGGRDSDALRKGRFIFDDTEAQELLLYRAALVNSLEDYGFRPPNFKFQSAFNRGLCLFLKTPVVDREYFVEKVSKTPHLIKYCTTYEKWISSFTEAYNFSRRAQRLHYTEDGQIYLA